MLQNLNMDTVDKKLYLCAILDLYDNSVVSHHIHHRNDNYLVFTTFKKAMKK